MRIITLLLLLSCNIAFSQALTSGGKLKSEQAIMDIRHYTIALQVDIKNKSISGLVTIDIILSQPAPMLLFDLMNNFSVQKIWINNKLAEFIHAGSVITVTTSTPIPAGRISVTIQYAGKPHVATRPPWEDGFTWAKDSTGKPFVSITAEGAGGKIYFPCKDHPSDEPNEGVDMLITVPKNLVVAGPGLLQSVNRKGNMATYFWKTNYSINNYSIVFNIADYVVVNKTYTSIDGNKIPMQFYVLRYHANKAAHHLELLEEMAKVKEKYFGEYPWAKEKIGIAETPHLGMEHQSMNAYGNGFKYEKVGGQDFDWLMNHEFGHEWWGNKVTAKDWADYWIHEGIGTFSDELYIRDKEGEQAYINAYKRDVIFYENSKPIVQGKNLDEESAYTADIYGKASFFMHTLRYVIGDSIFFHALKELATSPQYTYDNLITTDDVEQLFSKRSGSNLKPLFDLFLRTTKKLEVHVTAMRNNQYSIQLDNINMSLPADIITDKGVQKIMLGKKPVTVKSTILPQIDPDTYYIKKVIME
jgi:aminopeptidase N